MFTSSRVFIAYKVLTRFRLARFAQTPGKLPFDIRRTMSMSRKRQKKAPGGVPKTRIRGPRRATCSRFLSAVRTRLTVFPELKGEFSEIRRVFVTRFARRRTRVSRNPRYSERTFRFPFGPYDNAGRTKATYIIPSACYRPVSIVFGRNTAKKRRLPTRTPRRYRIDVFRSRRPLPPRPDQSDIFFPLRRSRSLFRT